MRNIPCRKVLAASKQGLNGNDDSTELSVSQVVFRSRDIFVNDAYV